MIKYFCKECQKEYSPDDLQGRDSNCPYCGKRAEMHSELFWCPTCNVPIYDCVCPNCGTHGNTFTSDARPVFPEERLLLEILKDNPLKYINDSVWCVNNRYYINGEAISISFSKCLTLDIENIQKKLDKYKEANKENSFEKYTQLFAKGNQERLNYLKDESFSFVKEAVKSYPSENIVISFSGGKDSTVVADIVVRALSNPGLMHIFWKYYLGISINL